MVLTCDSVIGDELVYCFTANNTVLLYFIVLFCVVFFNY